MANQQTNNNIIAKNTILLYARMLLILVVSLYTSRVVLATLGVVDYGLYNVVGGIVSMFSFLNAAMGNSSNRYITFALGKGNEENLNNVVSATCMIHWILAVIILVLAETVGLWFLHYKMVIPVERLVAAEWVYQFSVIACIVSIISVPYNALIIAHEKMGMFALITVMDTVLKLLIVFLIQVVGHDKLILYAALYMCVNVLDRIIYQIYCKKHFKESRKIRFRRFPELKEMTSFAGWSLLGNLAVVGYTQGLNILLNLFFGPAINAARGIAVQVQGAVTSFVTGFQTAVNPQIIKTYANGDFCRMHKLIYVSSKVSFFMLLCLALPICMEADIILDIWLSDVPEYTVIFTILVLSIVLVEPLRVPITIAINATGTIRNYQITEGGLLLLIVPVAYVVLKMGFGPVSVFIVQLVIMYLVQLIRLLLVCHKIKMSTIEYCRRVILRIMVVSVLSLILPLTLSLNLVQSIYSSILIIVVSIFSVLFFSYFMGLDNQERGFVLSKIIEIKARIFG